MEIDEAIVFELNRRIEREKSGEEAVYYILEESRKLLHTSNM